MVTPDDAPLWTIGYEHVSNVMVSVEQTIFNHLNTHVQLWEQNKAADSARDGRETEYQFDVGSWITPGVR